MVEKKGTLFLIEAKAGERINSKNLHFDRVATLFEKKYRIKKILAQNINESRILKTKTHTCQNPLLSRILYHPYNSRG